MEAGYFIIAILGCSDGSAACAPVATVSTRYETQAACAAATGEALLANSDLDFPRLYAECRPVKARAAASRERAKPVPAGAMRS